MNCWKAFNIIKEMGSTRLMIMSLLGTMSYYILFYLTLTSLIDFTGSSPFSFFLFLASVILVLPLHKMLHALPAWLAGKKARVYLEKGKWMPRIQCTIPGTMAKNLYIIVLLTPVTIITMFSLTMAFIFPEEVHYLSAIGSLNFGLSISDIFAFIYIFRSPAQSLIEESQNNCKILLKAHD